MLPMTGAFSVGRVVSPDALGNIFISSGHPALQLTTHLSMLALCAASES